MQASGIKKPIVRGSLFLGELMEWEAIPDVRFFFRDANGSPMCHDFPSLGHFEQWRDEQLNAQLASAIRLLKADKTRLLMELNDLLAWADAALSEEFGAGEDPAEVKKARAAFAEFASRI